MAYEVEVAFNPTRADEPRRHDYFGLLTKHNLVCTVNGPNSRISGIPNRDLDAVIDYLTEKGIQILGTKKYEFR